ncbi:hypothetical protein L7F22_057100 [Adiantum nelumboides]|nr:hypothetical protein [Adiantum nelumboides]
MSFRAGGLDYKVETSRKQNASSPQTVMQSVKKARMTQSGSNICTKLDQEGATTEETQAAVAYLGRWSHSRRCDNSRGGDGGTEGAK